MLGKQLFGTPNEFVFRQTLCDIFPSASYLVPMYQTASDQDIGLRKKYN